MRMLFWAILVVDFSTMLDDMSECDKPMAGDLPIERDLLHNFFRLFYFALTDKRVKLLNCDRQKFALLFLRR